MHTVPWRYCGCAYTPLCIRAPPLGSQTFFRSRRRTIISSELFVGKQPIIYYIIYIAIYHFSVSKSEAKFVYKEGVFKNPFFLETSAKMFQILRTTNPLRITALDIKERERERV